MELRKLKALLAALQAAGVTSYRDTNLTLQLGAAPMQVPRGDFEVEPGAETPWTPPAPMDLAREVARIQKAYETKGKAQ
jgi:hypothetical protein